MKRDMGVPMHQDHPRLPDPAACIAMTDAGALLDAFMATGSPLGEGLGLVATALGDGAAHPLFESRVLEAPLECAFRDILDGIARVAPRTANAWLNACFAEPAYLGRMSGVWVDGVPGILRGVHLGGCPWLSQLPDGLVVNGHLTLHGEQGVPGGLVRTPRNLVVHGNLYLARSDDFEGFSPGLVVDGFMDLEKCPKWDGTFPFGTRVGKLIYTDDCREGRMLDEFPATRFS